MYDQGLVLEADAVPKPGFGPGVRTGLCDRVRAEIASGAYESEMKLDLAVEFLAEDLASLDDPEDDDIEGFDDEDDEDLYDDDDDLDDDELDEEDVYGANGGVTLDALAESGLVRPAWLE